MPPKRKETKDNARKLGKSVPANKGRSRVRRTRKSVVRSKPGSNSGRAVDDERQDSEVARLMGALRAKKVPFQLIGMSAAVLQGVPVMTLDIDFWIGLPARQYMRMINLARQLGATVVRNTIVELKDGTLINFVYEVTGLGQFKTELRKAKLMDFHGHKVPVMPLESIQKSKQAIQRPKDLVHIEYITEALKMIGKNQKGKVRDRKN